MTSGNEAKVFGDVTRELWAVFQRHVGENGVLRASQIRSILNGIGLYPTKSQIDELVHCACESSGRAPVDHITFGEFVILVTELRECYRRRPHVVQRPRSQFKDTSGLVERRKKRRCSVFLGGSCNPTTWRSDIAIPYLRDQGITFYNPQVLDWQPELMELEDRAKQTAELLFFVIDNVTRSTASMVEAAYFTGCGYQLILVIKKFTYPGSVIANESISKIEYEDLERSHAFLTDLAERQCIPVFENIHTALACTSKALKQRVSVSDLTLQDGAQPVKCPHARVADKVIKLKDAFSAVDVLGTGRLPFHDVNLAYRAVTDENLPQGVGLEDKEFTIEQFCSLVAEYKYRRKSWWRRWLCDLLNLPTRFLDWLRGVSSIKPCDDEPRQRDVFLGGTCGSSRWRQLAIPILRKNGISYYNPQLKYWTTHYIPLEAAIRDNCRLLLYVITADTRGITSMLEAGHYIGMGCKVVLCIQNMQDGIVIDGEKLTPTAIKDYNRARTYLADLANRDNIPIFESVEEATECVVRKLFHGDC